MYVCIFVARYYTYLCCGFSRASSTSSIASLWRHLRGLQQLLRLSLCEVCGGCGSLDGVLVADWWELVFVGEMVMFGDVGGPFRDRSQRRVMRRLLRCLLVGIVSTCCCGGRRNDVDDDDDDGDVGCCTSAVVFGRIDINAYKHKRIHPSIQPYRAIHFPNKTPQLSQAIGTLSALWRAAK